MPAAARVAILSRLLRLRQAIGHAQSFRSFASITRRVSPFSFVITRYPGYWRTAINYAATDETERDRIKRGKQS